MPKRMCSTGLFVHSVLGFLKTVSQVKQIILTSILSRPVVQAPLVEEYRFSRVTELRVDIADITKKPAVYNMTLFEELFVSQQSLFEQKLLS
jgi:hypothetical protein